MSVDQTHHDCRPNGDPLARSLLVAQVRLHPVTLEEIRQYLEAEGDYRFAQRFYEELRDEKVTRIVEMALENVARCKRRRGTCRQRLATLGVHRRPVERGDEYDAQKHECVGRTPPPRPDQAGKIASAETELFHWTDHAGQPQFAPAKVILYEDNVIELSDPVGSSNEETLCLPSCLDRKSVSQLGANSLEMNSSNSDTEATHG